MKDAHAEPEPKNARMLESGQQFAPLQPLLPQAGHAMTRTAGQINDVNRCQFDVRNDRHHNEQSSSNAHVGGGLNLDPTNLQSTQLQLNNTSTPAGTVRANNYSLPVSLMTRKHFNEWQARAFLPSTDEATGSDPFSLDLPSPKQE